MPLAPMLVGYRGVHTAHQGAVAMTASKRYFNKPGTAYRIRFGVQSPLFPLPFLKWTLLGESPQCPVAIRSCSKPARGTFEMIRRIGGENCRKSIRLPERMARPGVGIGVVGKPHGIILFSVPCLLHFQLSAYLLGFLPFTLLIKQVLSKKLWQWSCFSISLTCPCPKGSSRMTRSKYWRACGSVPKKNCSIS